MPILDVEIIGHNRTEGLAQLLADAAEKVFEAEKGNIWVKVHYVPKSQYAENGGTSENLNPVFITAQLGQSYGKKDQGQVAVELTEVFSKVVERPKENIHIIFEPSLRGRIAFGGKMLK
jgi:phenylpyruvate tautomerase PptA (4-oxalocrotonate tautomerase family)